jgi:hypothetical protein
MPMRVRWCDGVALWLTVTSRSQQQRGMITPSSSALLMRKGTVLPSTSLSVQHESKEATRYIGIGILVTRECDIISRSCMLRSGLSEQGNSLSEVLSL